MSVVARTCFLWLSVLAGCYFDLDALRQRDAGPDRADAMPPRPDVVMGIDRQVFVDVPADVPIVDTGPARPPMMNTCALTVAGAIPPGANGVSVVEGNTTGGIMPLPFRCGMMVSMNSMRIYRYEVQSAGRVIATTNTGLCGVGALAGHDTILGAYFSCDAAGALTGSRACNDDDRENLCVACGSVMNAQGCGDEHATIELTNLVPRDVIYFAVASYNSGGTNPRGAFRLSVAEGGLRPVVPPTMGAPAPRVANRCMCPPSLNMAMTRDVMFPRMGMDANQLQNPASRSVFGPRTSPLATVWGVSARLHLSLYNVSNDGACRVPNGANAALDLVLGTQGIVASVALDSVVTSGAVTIPFTSFAPITLPTSAATTIEYRIRNIDPMSTNCVVLDVDMNAPNVITLYGAP